jgi:uncharacterized protein (DUF2141 family)
LDSDFAHQRVRADSLYLGNAMLDVRLNPNRRLGPRWIVGCVLALLVALQLTAAPGTVKISGRISGASGKGAIYVALWGADGFLKSPIQQIRIEPGSDPVYHFEVPAGRWAVSAFEDKNSNGKLDMGLFGPKEPSGFWHAFSGWHKPRFDEVAVAVDADVINADIALK